MTQHVSDYHPYQMATIDTGCKCGGCGLRLVGEGTDSLPVPTFIVFDSERCWLFHPQCYAEEFFPVPGDDLGAGDGVSMCAQCGTVIGPGDQALRIAGDPGDYSPCLCRGCLGSAPVNEGGAS